MTYSPGLGIQSCPSMVCHNSSPALVSSSSRWTGVSLGLWKEEADAIEARKTNNTKIAVFLIQHTDPSAARTICTNRRSRIVKGGYDRWISPVLHRRPAPNLECEYRIVRARREGDCGHTVNFPLFPDEPLLLGRLAEEFTRQVRAGRLPGRRGALQLFYFDAGRYPTTSEGLAALVSTLGMSKPLAFRRRME